MSSPSWIKVYKMDPFRLDDHKLMYHPQRLSDWIARGDIYPIYMEISPTSACNHRCVFCGLDFINDRKSYLKTDRLKAIIAELGRLGVKSIMYAGEGEPFLHEDLVDIIRQTKFAGIDTAVTTNGVLMKPEISENILGLTEWIKISCNAGTAETYSKIHRTDRKDFDRLWENLKQAVEIKRNNRYSCALGIQKLLLPENENEIEKLVIKAKEIGLDYVVIKPYSHHPQSRTVKYKDIRYGDHSQLADMLKKFNSPTFRVVFRLRSMRHWDHGEKGYRRCLALPFWSYIDAAGNVWGCSVYLNDERFYYGNIIDDDFAAVWNGQKRKQSLSWMENSLDAGSCRVNCRMDAINRYLNELKFPPRHVNFI